MPEKEQPQQHQPPREITKNFKKEKRTYFYMLTVKSLEELEKFRLKNYCAYGGITRRQQNIFKSCILPCPRRIKGKGCKFELRAVRPSLKRGIIHVYAHSRHNHPIIPEEKRVPVRNEKALMANANPPMIFATADNIQWTFMKTLSNYKKLKKCCNRMKCSFKMGREKNWRIRNYCKRRPSDNCEFMLLALKTTKQRYHVYRHGEHKHNNSHLAQRRNENEEEEVDEDSEEEDVVDDDNEDDVEDEEQIQEDEQPPRSITKTINGQNREYHFLKTVKSVEELDKFRFTNYCRCINKKDRNTFKSTILSCTKQKRGHCEFELRAVRSDLESDEIHVYAHSQHNHPIESEEKRSLNIQTKHLISHENPPNFFRTADNIECKFLQTFSNYEKMQKFRFKNQCKTRWANNGWRIRFSCNRRWYSNCNFMLLAMKTTKQGYHVYTHGEHNHADIKPNMNFSSFSKKRQKQRRKQQIIGDDENEEEEEGNEDGEECGEDDEVKVEKKGKVNRGVPIPIPMEESEDEIIEHEEMEDDEEGEEELLEEQQEEDKPIKQDVKGFKIEMIEGNPREEILKEKLAKANENVYKWMAGIGPNEIEGTIGDWDKLSLLKMVEMADQEIPEHPQKLNLWLPWLKCAIPKCLPQIEGFNVRFKDLVKLTFD